MTRQTANIVVDSLGLAAFVLLAATGSLIKLVLPPGSGHFSTLWGMDRHQWGDVHFWIAVTLVCIVVVHLCLHWPWIRGVVRGRAGVAIAALLVLLGLAAAPFAGSVQRTERESPHRLRSDAPPAAKSPDAPPDAQPQAEELRLVSGSMTLLEVERLTGVSAAVILEGLGLPPDTPKDERLGRLRRRYGFDMHDVSNIVQRHHGKQ